MNNVLCLILSLLFSTVSFASTEVVLAKGKVGYKSPKMKKWKIVEEGMNVPAKSQLRTGKSSILRINHGGTIVSVGAKSHMTLGAEKLTKAKSTSLSLIKGFIWANVEKTDKKKKDVKFFVKTKSASMGVRGTQFAVSHSDEKGALTCVCEGRVDVHKGKNISTLTRGNGLESVAGGKDHNKDYMKLMRKGVPKKAFMKLVKRDKRYQSCLYCHNKDFDIKDFSMPGSYEEDLTNLDYD